MSLHNFDRVSYFFKYNLLTLTEKSKDTKGVQNKTLSIMILSSRDLNTIEYILAQQNSI